MMRQERPGLINRQKKIPPGAMPRGGEICYAGNKKARRFRRAKVYVLCVSSLPNAVWSNRAYTDKQILLWSEITPFYFKNQPESCQNFASRKGPHKIPTFPAFPPRSDQNLLSARVLSPQISSSTVCFLRRIMRTGKILFEGHLTHSWRVLSSSL